MLLLVNSNGVCNYPSYREFRCVDCTKVIFNHLHYGIRIKCLYKDPVYKEFGFLDYLIKVFKGIGY